MPTRMRGSEHAGGWIGPLIGALAVLLAGLAAVSLAVGPVSIGAAELIRALTGTGDPAWQIIVHEVRLPRTVLAAAVGATLGLGGAALQGFLRNPLAEPAILGTSASAALGAVVPLYFGLADLLPLSVPLGGIAGALAGVLALMLLAGRDATALTLILAGVAVGSFAGAATALALNLASNPFAALEITFWLLGSLEDRSMEHVRLALPLMAAGWLLLAVNGRALAALSLGEDTATTLGVRLGAVRLRLMLGIGLAVGAAVAVSGTIGFVGLVVPHLLRPLVGQRPDALLLPSALAGAALLLAADCAVRLIPTAEPLKLGVLTATVGAPFFLWLILSLRRQLA